MTDADLEEPTDEETDEQPKIDEDELADAPDFDDLADEVEAEAGATNDESEDVESTEASTPKEDPGSADDSWGDMYVGTLTSLSNAIIEQHGKQDAEMIDEDLARQLHLDEYFDEWMAQRGKQDMPPEQAILIGTTMFLVVVVGTKTDLASQALEEVDL